MPTSCATYRESVRRRQFTEQRKSHQQNMRDNARTRGGLHVAAWPATPSTSVCVGPPRCGRLAGIRADCRTPTAHLDAWPEMWCLRCPVHTSRPTTSCSVGMWKKVSVSSSTSPFFPHDRSHRPCTTSVEPASPEFPVAEPERRLPMSAVMVSWAPSAGRKNSPVRVCVGGNLFDW